MRSMVERGAQGLAAGARSHRHRRRIPLHRPPGGPPPPTGQGNRIDEDALEKPSSSMEEGWVVV